jgi:hypothetical protein
VSNVKETGAGVKHETRPGRPALRSVAIEREIVRACAREAVVNGKVPSDSELGQQVGLGERTVRDVRLQAGLNRRDIKAWIRERQTKESPSPEEGVLCWTPFAGLWLLVPLIMKTVFWSAASQLEWTVKTGVTATSWVLTILMWAVLGFRRFFHLDDFRHHADLGLALFTGRTCLLADSTVWRLVHSVKPKSAETFYQQTAAEAVPLDAPKGEEWLSMDEHVVGFFSKLKPRPLGKTRVPTHGRCYPAIRLYAPFHLYTERFMGLVVTKARVALSQVLPTLIAEVRRLREKAGHPEPKQVDLILDRGAYKGTLFQSLMDDDHVRFIAMARPTKKNKAQWETIPEERFSDYQPEGEHNSHLRIAETTTTIKDCQHKLRTVVIRDDTPDSKQRWRCMFVKVPAAEMSPATVDARYRERQKHENSFAELDHYLAGKCLPKPYALKREGNSQGEKRKTVGSELSEETMTGLHLVAWLRHWAFNLIKDFGESLGEPYATMHVGTLVRKFIARPGVLQLKAGELWVGLAPFTGSEALAGCIQRINQQRIAIPWLGHLVLQMEVASLPVGLAAQPRAAARRVFANRQSPVAT